jgi:hypothetical protein
MLVIFCHYIRAKLISSANTNANSNKIGWEIGIDVTQISIYIIIKEKLGLLYILYDPKNHYIKGRTYWIPNTPICHLYLKHTISSETILQALNYRLELILRNSPQLKHKNVNESSSFVPTLLPPKFIFALSSYELLPAMQHEAL